MFVRVHTYTDSPYLSAANPVHCVVSSSLAPEDVMVLEVEYMSNYAAREHAVKSWLCLFFYFFFFLIGSVWTTDMDNTASLMLCNKLPHQH